MDDMAMQIRTWENHESPPNSFWLEIYEPRISLNERVFQVSWESLHNRNTWHMVAEERVRGTLVAAYDIVFRTRPAGVDDARDDVENPRRMAMQAFMRVYEDNREPWIPPPPPRRGGM